MGNFNGKLGGTGDCERTPLAAGDAALEPVVVLGKLFRVNTEGVRGRVEAFVVEVTV